MNAKVLYAATVVLALISSTAAMASDATEFANGPSTRSRAEVVAELKASRAAGQLNERGESYGLVQPSAGSSLTRAEVLADAARARALSRAGASDRDYGYGYPAPQTASTRSRDEVRAEARAAARARLDSPKVNY